MPRTTPHELDGYTCLLVPDPTGGYSAAVLEWPGCVAEGATASSAMQALTRAAAAWQRAARQQGQDIPPPLSGTARPSGRIALRVPPSLHRRAQLWAARDGVSLNQFLVAAIATYVGVKATLAPAAPAVPEKQKRRRRTKTRSA